MSKTDAITVCTTRTVRAGCEKVFEQRLHEFVQRSLIETGHLGVYVVRPPPDSNSSEYGILRRFANAVDRDNFYSSQGFHEWQQKVAPLTEGALLHEHVSGLETWFMLPGRPAFVPPPRWKMALVTFIGVYAITSILPVFTMPMLSSWNSLLSNLVFSGLVVALLTWIVMPFLTKIFAGWLFVDINKQVIGDKS
jgi:antibiotic biosynthesis monooxygenase (ABM) superfamily enzyme